VSQAGYGPVPTTGNLAPGFSKQVSIWSA